MKTKELSPLSYSREKINNWYDNLYIKVLDRIKSKKIKTTNLKRATLVGQCPYCDKFFPKKNINKNICDKKECHNKRAAITQKKRNEGIARRAREKMIQDYKDQGVREHYARLGRLGAEEEIIAVRKTKVY